MDIHRNFSNLEFVVQDISMDMLAQGQSRDIGCTISSNHNQSTMPTHFSFANACIIRPTKGASRCYKRWSLHFQHAGAHQRENLQEHDSGRTRVEENDPRQMDFPILVVLGMKQRSESEFRKVVSDADPRFRVSGELWPHTWSFV